MNEEASKQRLDELWRVDGEDVFSKLVDSEPPMKP